MKLFRFTVFFCLMISASALSAGTHGNEIIGVAYINSDSVRGTGFANMIESHISEISSAKNIFDPVSPGKLEEELSRFDCFDEACFLNFASRAGIAVVVTGDLRDFDDYFKLELRGYASGEPFYGRILLEYSARIPVTNRSTPYILSLIAEEHSIRFLSAFLKNYVSFVVPGREDDGSYVFPEGINGRFRVYRSLVSESPREFAEDGFTDIRSGNPVSGIKDFSEGRGILVDHKKLADELEDIYLLKKRELVFRDPLPYSTLYVGFFAVPASAAMPVAAPFFGYYNNNDWQGLLLWMLNGTPYIGMQVKGFIDSPDRNAGYTRDELVMNRFAWYMLLAGGMPLFTDAVAGGYLNEASDFQGQYPIMGRRSTAVLLSFIGGGGGYFYRGERTLGYISFHANNLLVYFALRDLSPGRYYDDESQKYVRESANRNRGYALLGAVAALSFLEAFHVSFMNDRISNGRVRKEYFSVSPEIFVDSNNKSAYGLRFSYVF